jgi:hypothetical protein
VGAAGVEVLPELPHAAATSAAANASDATRFEVESMRSSSWFRAMATLGVAVKSRGTDPIVGLARQPTVVVELRPR